MIMELFVAYSTMYIEIEMLTCQHSINYQAINVPSLSNISLVSRPVRMSKCQLLRHFPSPRWPDKQPGTLLVYGGKVRSCDQIWLFSEIIFVV